MSGFNASEGGRIIRDLIKTIQNNRDYLSQIDGQIGDGDHGINMNKGFTIYSERLGNTESISLDKALKGIGRVLLMEIGGSMGPLYGTFFIEMSKKCEGLETVDARNFSEMLSGAISGISGLSNAKVGDKTLMDALVPALEAYDAALAQCKGFADALADLKVASEKGKESTRDMVARLGRASRLGERSRGVLDAGATSCNLILQSLADSITALLV
jgi:dihydroxyacetone kinase-like protein